MGRCATGADWDGVGLIGIQPVARKLVCIPPKGKPSVCQHVAQLCGGFIKFVSQDTFKDDIVQCPLCFWAYCGHP